MTNTLISWQRLLLLLALTAGLTLTGCGDSPDDDDDSAGDDDDATDDDDSAGDDDDATDDDDSSADDDDSSADDDDDSAASAPNLSGSVTRAIDPVTGQDGIGDLYVVVLGENPMKNPMQLPISQTMVPGADFSAAGASVAYSISDVPLRDEPYFITAILDDDVSGPIPNDTDLGAVPVALTIDDGGEYTQDLVLAAPIPSN